jgi:NADPH2:quinone reductase
MSVNVKPATETAGIGPATPISRHHPDSTESARPYWETVLGVQDSIRSTAAVLASPGRFRVEPVMVPPPGPGQVRVQLEGCGICASNLPVWEGRPWFRYPLAPGAPGHEGWGRIDAVGPEVEGLSVGDRVAMLSYNAYARHDLAEARATVVLPPELDGLAFPGEPLGCAMNIFRRSAIKAGETVAVVGVGFLGALLIRLAAAAGAWVVALSRRPCALDIARRQGAAETISTADFPDAARRARALTDETGYDCVIEVAGEQTTLNLAAELTRVRGRLIVAGYHQGGLRQVDMQLWNWRGLDVINAHERDPEAYLAGMRAAVEAVAAGQLDPSPLITHRVSLADLAKAFRMLRERPDGFLKAVLEFQRPFPGRG